MHRLIGLKVEVGTFLDGGRRSLATMCCEGECRRTGCSFYRCGGRRMVTVGVGYQDMADGFAPYGLQQGVDMRVVGRPRIDDCNLFAADYVGAGSVKGKRSRVAGDNAADQRA